MIINNIAWIRSHSVKLCPKLKKQVLEWYRPTRSMPCLMHRGNLAFKRQWQKIPVIVQLEEPEIVSLSASDLASSAGCRVKRRLPVINSFSTDVNEKSLKQLLATKKVKKIWYDSEVKTLLQKASPTVAAPPLWETGLTGKGITVAVLDTGIHEHADLNGRIAAFKDFIGGRGEAYDDNGHGTHVAGCAASGCRENGGYKGPAPEAELVGIKVLSKTGAGSLSTIIEAVQWCIEHKEQFGIRIMNLSLGSEAYQSYRDDPLCQAVEKAWNSGIVVCAAAGNSGPERGTISSPGIDPLIITVGASNDRDAPEPAGNTVAHFSSRGPTIDGLLKPDVLAPGVEIVSLRAPGSLLDRTNKDARVGSGYFSLSGTSMATPVCAGVAAQLLQADSSLEPNQVKELLLESAVIIPGVESSTQGSGIVNGYKAEEALDKKPAGTALSAPR